MKQARQRCDAAAGQMISAARFASEAQAFAAAWNSCSGSRGSWVWRGSRSPFSRALGGGYLAMEGVPQLLRAEAADPEQGQGCDLDTEDAAAAPAGKAEFCRFDYHVLFHPSYQVPALYFNAYNTGGELLSLAAMEDHFQRFNSPGGGVPNSSWMFVAAEEHPILKRPVYMLHPCRTAEVMQLLLAGAPSTRNVPDLPAKARNIPDLSASLCKRSRGTSAQSLSQHPASGATAAVSDGERSELQASEPSTEASVCREWPLGQYLAAWFSVFGPAVGLKLPKEMWPGANHVALRGIMLPELTVA